jgi:glycosyltransferase involved in cell wall biosynthesis
LAKLPFLKRPGLKKITYRQHQTEEDWSYRSPLYFLKTISNLMNRKSDLKNRIEFHHIGHLPNWLNKMVNEYNLNENFIAHGFVSKSENIAIQSKFNALLCTSEKVINGEHYCLSSKVFDYVQMKKPILGFVTPGAMKVFIEQSGCGVIFDPDNIDESSRKLEELINSYLEFNPNKNYLEKFLAENLSNSLTTLINSLI